MEAVWPTADPIQFTRAEIVSYTFELGVRADGTTEAQWEQIYEAYHGARRENGLL